MGLKNWHSRGDAAAIPFFRRAVEVDPQFATAHARLAQTYTILWESSLAHQSIRQAYALRNRVSERERLYIESQYYLTETGELEKAIEVNELWQQIYPRDVTPYNNLATLYGFLGKFEKALKDAQEALRLAPDSQDNYVALFYVYVGLNRLDEAEAVLKRAEERKLESDLLLEARYHLAFLRDDVPQMEQLMAAAAGKPNLESWLLGWSGCAAGYHGQLRTSRKLFRKSVESAEIHDNAQTAATYLAALSLVEAYLGDMQHARTDAEAALRVWRSDWAVLALALAGRTLQAQSIVDALNRDFPQDWLRQRLWLPSVRAVVALERKDPDAAVRLLEQTSPYELGGGSVWVPLGTWTQLDPIYIRGQAYLLQRNGSAAATEFQKIIDNPGWVECNPVGSLARLGLGRAYAVQGDTAKAKTAYNDFFTLWKDADPDVPIFKQAEAEYGKLQ
jgi:tetratricopeptide (TPR) repeat protein